MPASNGVSGVENANLHLDADGGGRPHSTKPAAEEAVPPAVATWTIAQVANWMREQSQIDGAEKIADKLAEEEVDGDMLMAYATMKEVKEDLGLTSGKANKVWRAMRALIDPQVEPAALSSASSLTQPQPPQPQLQQQQVPPAPGAEREEHFVVRATGKIMSKTDLFEQEIPKSQCWTLTEYATVSRERISQSIMNAAKQQTLLSSGLSRIEKELAVLDTACVDIKRQSDAILESHAQRLQLKTVEILKEKQARLLAVVKTDAATIKETLETQRNDLLVRQAARERVCTAGASVCAGSDAEVVEAAPSLSGDIEVSTGSDVLVLDYRRVLI